MVTKSKQGSNSRARRGGGGGDKSAFSFEGGATGALIGAAVAGAAIGIAANFGRKLLVQMGSGAAGNWVDALKAEHALALAIFDRIEETDDSDTAARSALLAKLKYALDKHAHQEENVIYPALRQANDAKDADMLTSEHGYVKTFLYELETLPKDSPDWLARVGAFRAMIEGHMRVEEDEVFPAFEERLSDDQNEKLTALMHKEGFKLA